MKVPKNYHLFFSKKFNLNSMIFLNEMNALFVESVKNLHEIVDIHRPSSLFTELDAIQNLIHKFLHIQVRVDRPVVERAVDPVVFLQHENDGCLGKGRTQCFVLPDKGNSG